MKRQKRTLNEKLKGKLRSFIYYEVKKLEGKLIDPLQLTDKIFDFLKHTNSR